MRHLKKSAKLGRTSSHRNALLANLACSLIKSRRITTTIEKAKALRPFAEKLVTLGKRGNQAVETANTAEGLGKATALAENVHCRRLAAARLRQQARSFFNGTKKYPGKTKRLAWKEKEDVVHILFDKIAPVFKTRPGGYARILRLGQRRGDVATMAIIEWVESTEVAEVPAEGAETAK